MGNASQFGVKIGGDVSVDFAYVMERMRRLRASIAPVDSAERYAKQLGVDLFIGKGAFTGSNTIEVNGKTLKFAKAVVATGGNYLHKKIADVTTTHLEFSSGLRAHIFVSWLHPFKEQKLIVVGDRKMAMFDDSRPWNEKLLLYPHQIKWENNIPIPAKAEPEYVEVVASSAARG